MCHHGPLRMHADGRRTTSPLLVQLRLQGEVNDEVRVGQPLVILLDSSVTRVQLGQPLKPRRDALRHDGFGALHLVLLGQHLSLLPVLRNEIMNQFPVQRWC